MQSVPVSSPIRSGRVQNDRRPEGGAKRPRNTIRSAIKAAPKPYDRNRDLPGLLALWPCEIKDQSVEGHQRMLKMLRRALRLERQRGISGHWTYDLVRHARLLAAYKQEAASLRSRDKATLAGRNNLTFVER